MNVDNSKTTLIEFCAGYGGIGLGLKRAIPNLCTIALCEIESFAIENLIAKMEAGRIDKAPIWNDLKTFPSAEFHGLVDILTAGFPCQPFSNAGLKKGDEDERHLFPYILRAIESMRPRFVLLENVEGILSAKLASDCWTDPVGTPVLLHVLRELERRGYEATWGVFSAEEVGAPHQRKRVFILAHSISTMCERRLLQDGDSGRTVPQLSQSYAGESSSIRNEADGCSCLCGEELAYYSEQRVQGCGSGRIEESRPYAKETLSVCSGNTGGVWPSRPGQPQYEWEPPRTTTGQTKSTMGGSVDGAADWMDYAVLCESGDNRVDELRLLGNGVVPATAEKAWRVLYHRLMEE